MRAHRRRVPLRVALLTLVVGLVLLTVALTATVAAVTGERSVQDLQRRYFRATSEAIAARVRGYLEPAATVLADVRSQVLEGRVSLADRADLGRYLLARLRHQPHLAWLSWSDDATGRFVGAWRDDDGRLVLNRSDPKVDGGRPEELVFEPDGTVRTLDRGLAPGYDPRKLDWYARAIDAPGVLWTEPFEFNERRLGITCALALRAAGEPRPRGVLTADFFLESLARWLDGIAGDESTSVAVLTRAGNVVASAWQPPTLSARAARLAPALRTAPVSPAALRPGESPSWAYDEQGTRRIAAVTTATTEGGAEWVVLVSVPEERFLEGVHGNRRLALLLGGAVALLAVGLGWFLSRRISRPLGRVSEHLGRVSRFDLGAFAPPPSRVREVNDLASAVERMTASLRSFGRYVPTALVRELVAGGQEARLGGERREVTLLFSDLVGFTSLSETMDPTALVELLGEYFGAVCSGLQARGATIDKFLGDGIMAFWNAPHEVEGHPGAACAGALEVRDVLRTLSGRWQAAGRPALRARMGLHTGSVLVGNVGTPDRFGYTAIGDAVNLASRLETLNKRYGTDILASGQVLDRAGPGFEWRRLERVAVAGRQSDVLAVELLGRTGTVAPETLAARDVYEAALDAFAARRFAEAADGFRRALEARPHDRAAGVLRERAAQHDAAPPPPDWTDVALLAEK